MPDLKQYIAVSYQDIDTVFPTVFVDKIYLEHQGIIKTGVYSEEFKTESKHNTVFKSLYKSQLIQALVFDRYKFSFIKTETYNAELLKFAQTIVLYDFGNRTYYTPEIISIESNKVKGWDVITVEFYDINSANYPNDIPLINNFRNDIIKVKHSTQLATLVKVQLLPYAVLYTYYGMIPPVITQGEPENIQESELYGQTLTSRITTKKDISTIFYFNDSDLQLFMEQAPKCSIIDNITLTYDGNTYTNKERPEVVVETIAGAIQLHKVTLKFTTDVDDFYKYDI